MRLAGTAPTQGHPVNFLTPLSEVARPRPIDLISSVE